jgi:hypothetical protein
MSNNERESNHSHQPPSRFDSIRLCLILSLVVGIAVNEAAKYAATKLARLAVSAPIHNTLIPNLVASAVMLVAVTLGVTIALRIQGRGIWDLGLKSDRWLYDSGIGCLVGLSMTLLFFGLILPLTGGSNRSDVVALQRSLVGGALSALGLIITGWIVGGYTEELFFREFVITTLQRLFGKGRLAITAAVLCSSVFFGCAHAYQGWAGVAETMVTGLSWSVLYVWRRCLVAPMVAHGLFDMLNFLGILWLCTGSQ